MAVPVLEQGFKLQHKGVMKDPVQQNLAAVQARIAAAAKASSRSPEDITLIAVSKTFGAQAIKPILATGQIDFGENRVQEAAAKWPPLRVEYPASRLHLIGALQSNKAENAVAFFDAIHSLDRPKLAMALAAAMTKLERKPQLFIQVNTGDEQQKAGVALAEVEAFIDECRNVHGLKPIGLMCIPPLTAEPEIHFDILRKLAERHGLSKLSMGMSGDFEKAIACGATHVRVGSSIFGGR